MKVESGLLFFSAVLLLLLIIISLSSSTRDEERAEQSRVVAPAAEGLFPAHGAKGRCSTKNITNRACYRTVHSAAACVVVRSM